VIIHILHVIRYADPHFTGYRIWWTTNGRHAHTDTVLSQTVAELATRGQDPWHR